MDPQTLPPTHSLIPGAPFTTVTFNLLCTRRMEPFPAQLTWGLGSVWHGGFPSLPNPSLPSISGHVSSWPSTSLSAGSFSASFPRCPRRLFLNSAVQALLLPSHLLSLRPYMPPASPTFHVLDFPCSDISPELQAHISNCCLLDLTP